MSGFASLVRRWPRLRWATLGLLVWFFAGALLFCTSMLSTTRVVSDTATEVCPGLQKPVDQVVLVLIDAMRPDFVFPALRRFAQHTGGACSPPSPHELDNPVDITPTLTYIEDALRNISDASHGMFLVADAPTTTAQRIKAIATGTMPAFLEAGSNFNSEATAIDSVVRQMQGNAVLLGDDTWTKLFPNTASVRHWKHAVDIPSFNVADFDSNDDAVLDAIYPTLRKETLESAAGGPPAKLIIAHFLGVDHIGHRLNADNPAMSRKLKQLNEMLQNVSDTLRRRPTAMNTMMLVMGDHGMTNSGDHGGDSTLETDTFLFAQYYRGSRYASRLGSPDEEAESAARRTRLAALTATRWSEKIDGDLNRLQACRAASRAAREKLSAAFQVDVTPTIAALLGVPTPFSSLGRVIPEVLALAEPTANITAAECCNEAQLHRFFAASGMKLPRNATWAREGTTCRTRLAQMGYYARRTRTEMSRGGMYIGCWMLLTAAFSILWLKQVQACFLPHHTLSSWTAVVVIAHIAASFANSFVVNEDSEVRVLFSVLVSIPLLASCPAARLRRMLCGAARHARRKVPLTNEARVHAGADDSRGAAVADWLLLASVVVVLRFAADALFRHRAHVTHMVEDASRVDQLMAQLPFGRVTERAGIVVGCVVAVASYCQKRGEVVLIGLTGALMMCAYKVPVVHHLVPLVCIALSRVNPPSGTGVTLADVWRRRLDYYLPLSSRWYGYAVWVLWTSTLCNEKCGPAVVIALYGMLLPRLVRALDGLPHVTQATALHLLAYVAFFAEGHQCMLNTIDWNASFVGMPGYSMLIGGVLVISRTFNAFMFPSVALALSHRMDGYDADLNPRRAAGHVPQQHEHEHEGEDGAMTASSRGGTGALDMQRHLLLHLFVIEAAVTCFNGYIQKSHLMLFPIFCPKLLFDVVIGLTAGLGFILSVVCV